MEFATTYEKTKDENAVRAKKKSILQKAHKLV